MAALKPARIASTRTATKYFWFCRPGIPGHGFVAVGVAFVAHAPGLVIDRTLAADIAFERHEQDRAGLQ